MITIHNSTSGDLQAIMQIQVAAYPKVELESYDVFEEKLRLFGEGCFVAKENTIVVGYLFSHPWTITAPPKFDTFLGKMPTNADCYYIHDLAVRPDKHGCGIGKQLFLAAKQTAIELNFTTFTLIAVQGSRPYWEKQGFQDIPASGVRLGDTLLDYQTSDLEPAFYLCAKFA